jgi:hypothetical protein
MASIRSGLTSEGALYEAIARGNKDTYFFSQHLETAHNTFDRSYEPVPPIVHERRRIPPLNGAEFGRSCEFEFEIAGDVFLKPTVLIDLPSWIPPHLRSTNNLYRCVDAGGNSYGYTNGIGYFLFSKIQIYQDKILLYEFAGDTLWASRAARGSLNSAYQENALTGWHDGSPAAISFAATPQRLRLELPFLGTANRGFPSIAMRAQNFKLRLTLRKLEELVESSDPARTTAPAPWLLPTLAFEGPDEPIEFQPLVRTSIDPPTLQLETRHIYTDSETQQALKQQTLELPYLTMYENTFTYGPFEYAPIERGSTAAVTKRVDARHPASRLFWFFRSQNDLRANRRWKVAADISGSEYYLNQSLIIAGRDRETLFPPQVWNKLIHHTKEDRDPGPGFGEMNWDLGAVRSHRPPFYDPRPEGSVNFTTADRPTLYTELANVPPDSILGKPSTELTAVIESWAIYTIENNRGFLKYSN